MRKLTLCVYLLACTFCAVAQFNDSTTHYIEFAASGNINTTNTGNSYLLNNEARFSIKNKKRTMNTFVGWVYGESNNNLTNNDFNATYDFNLYNKKGNFYYWGLANYTSSYSLKINNQLQAGLGVAYNVTNTDVAWFNLSEGILYETSSLVLNDSANSKYQTLRNSFRLSYRFVIGKIIILSGSNFIQNAFSNRNDYILRTNNSASIKLNEWLSLATSLTYNQFRRTGSENLLFTYGLKAEKFF